MTARLPRGAVIQQDPTCEALAISREVKDRRVEALELLGLMENWQTSGQPRLAIFYEPSSPRFGVI